MFIPSPTFVSPNDEGDKVMEQHMAWHILATTAVLVAAGLDVLKD